MLKTFRILNMIEGLSLIALLFIVMPAKYQFDIDLVKFVGPIHSVLWLAYLPMLDATNPQQNFYAIVRTKLFHANPQPFSPLNLE